MSLYKLLCKQCLSVKIIALFQFCKHDKYVDQGFAEQHFLWFATDKISSSYVLKYQTQTGSHSQHSQSGKAGGTGLMYHQSRTVNKEVDLSVITLSTYISH